MSRLRPSGDDRCRKKAWRRGARHAVVLVWGCEGSALAPPARTRSVSPNLRSLCSLPDWAVPPPILFLLPPTRSRRRAGVHARNLRRTPVTKGERHEQQNQRHGSKQGHCICAFVQAEKVAQECQTDSAHQGRHSRPCRQHPRPRHAAISGRRASTASFRYGSPPNRWR